MMDMEEGKLAIIKDLMEQLIGEMEYSDEDLSERLGRKKPGVEVLKIEGKMPMSEGMDGEDMAESGDDMAMTEMADGMEEDPEDSFKRRLMKLRG